MVKNKDLKHLLNINYIDLTEQTYCIGKYDLPYVDCPDNVDIDYLALYSHIGDYNKTSNTAVCFYQYDNVFDGQYGLFNAIYYNDVKLLEYYKKRFENVDYLIAPDYSLIGDLHTIENYYRLFKARIVSLWFILELDKIVIPNITYANEDYFDIMLDGLENCNTVAFSTKGSIKNPIQRELLKKAIIRTVDSLCSLKKIIVYSVCSDNNVILNIFEYARKKGIEVVIPANVLQIKNIERKLNHG